MGRCSENEVAHLQVSDKIYLPAWIPNLLRARGQALMLCHADAPKPDLFIMFLDAPILLVTPVHKALLIENEYGVWLLNLIPSR